ncbi:MAG TPA: alkaline phosphatase D family protein [Pseudonocardiaceae bacterium]|nr:alkaline phosphatase D family protein [Pseudonocardiaceae bacterium]
MPERPVNRRIFVLGGLAAAGTAALPGWTGASTPAPRSVTPNAIRYPFELGVASGDPTPDGVVLWTRLAPAPLNTDGHGGMPNADVTVDWEVAGDQSFASVVASGSTVARYADAHSVHVEPVGLAPDREYFYRFRADGHISPAGRTRTAPPAGAMPAQLRFAFGSCQHWEEGWYHAHRGITADRPDLVLFLGDYLYENPSSALSTVRGYVITSEADTLAEYRHRYAQHRTDPQLQAAHAVAPWLVVFDDHEVENNWNSTNQTAARREAAFRAFYENMPLRRSSLPVGSSIPLYRRIQWGALARFHMLDTRQYRNAQAPTGSCSTMRDPARTITGGTQEQWLLAALAQQTARWDFLGQQVFFAQRDDDNLRSTCLTNSTDAWDGYTASRDRIAAGWVQRGVRNPVVLTGDVHRHWAADLRLDYYDHSAPIIGSELVTTSITSSGAGGSSPPSQTWMSNNPHIRYWQDQRGYVLATLTPAQLTAEFKIVTPSVLEPNPANVTIRTDRRFALLDGQRGLQNA